ncbi:hypothetical protein LCGC14_2938050 [marine sediment metagenome]|uniref:Chromosomal replication initiator DnaA C-terminal domain-containing protein n=1 Tax=marine sediment metagenome TaxID=412755 RepID=A0A0F8Y5Z9_9ZZZZ
MTTSWIAIRPQLVLKNVAEYYGLTTTILRSRVKYKEIVRARTAFIWLAREHKLMSWPSIGRILNKHHTTCIFAHRRAQKLIQTDPLFSQELVFIEALLEASSISYTAIAIH